MKISKILVLALSAACLPMTAQAQSLQGWSIDLEAGWAEREDQRFETGAMHYANGPGAVAAPNEAQALDLNGETWRVGLARALDIEVFGARPTLFGSFRETTMNGRGEVQYVVRNGPTFNNLVLTQQLNGVLGTFIGSPIANYDAFGVAEASISQEETRLGVRFNRQIATNFTLDYGIAVLLREEDAQSQYRQTLGLIVSGSPLNSTLNVTTRSEDVGVELAVGLAYDLNTQSRLFAEARAAHVERETQMNVFQTTTFSSGTAAFADENTQTLIGIRAGAELRVTDNVVVQFAVNAQQDQATPLFRGQTSAYLSFGGETKPAYLDEQESWTSHVGVSVGYRF